MKTGIGTRAWLLALAMAVTATAATAQSGTATIYRDRNFSGPAVAVSQTSPNMRLNFQVQSVRINGGAWELCQQANFRGDCLVVGQTTSDLRRTYNWAGPLQSMRPVNGGSGGGGSGGGSSQQSLRGMASEFFPAPRNGRNPGAARVLACPGSNNASPVCASQNADRFCRTMGWNGSARELMETVNRRAYLADVLCVRSGF